MDAFLLSTAVILVAALGDKTMLAIITLATREGWFGTWVGSTVGRGGGRRPGRRRRCAPRKKLPENVIRWGAAALFALFGVLLVVEGVRGLG